MFRLGVGDLERRYRQVLSVLDLDREHRGVRVEVEVPVESEGQGEEEEEGEEGDCWGRRC